MKTKHLLLLYPDLAVKAKDTHRRYIFPTKKKYKRIRLKGEAGAIMRRKSIGNVEYCTVGHSDAKKIYEKGKARGLLAVVVRTRRKKQLKRKRTYGSRTQQGDAD